MKENKEVVLKYFDNIIDKFIDTQEKILKECQSIMENIVEENITEEDKEKIKPIIDKIYNKDEFDELRNHNNKEDSNEEESKDVVININIDATDMNKDDLDKIIDVVSASNNTSSKNEEIKEDNEEETIGMNFEEDEAIGMNFEEFVEDPVPVFEYGPGPVFKYGTEKPIKKCRPTKEHYDDGLGNIFERGVPKQQVEIPIPEDIASTVIMKPSFLEVISDPIKKELFDNLSKLCKVINKDDEEIGIKYLYGISKIKSPNEFEVTRLSNPYEYQFFDKSNPNYRSYMVYPKDGAMVGVRIDPD